jgi:hypothetical protein
MDRPKTLWRWFLFTPLFGAVIWGLIGSQDGRGLQTAKAAGAALNPWVFVAKSGELTAATPETVTPTPVPEVIVEQPQVTPPFTETCSSGWLPLENKRGHTAYLTLNVKEGQPVTNSGQWLATLSQPGYYRVEAYIPYHKAVDWDCPDVQEHIGWDTSEARYTISYTEEQNAVTGDQKLLSDEWLDLGEYLFEDPGNVQVELTNVTGEETHSTTVSMSAVRFTWTRPPGSKAYLPLMRRALPEVTLSSTWSSDQNGFTKAAFVQSEAIRFYASGINTSGVPAQAKIEWSVESPCGVSQFFSENQMVEDGSWSNYLASVVPECLGLYTFTVQVEFQGQISSIENYFVVNNSSSAQVSAMPAFDKCSAPEIAQMETWWHSSPYYTANLYIGGVHSSCSNSHLNAFWIHEVSQQGWDFIPTWVGPQAPCSSFIHKMSANLATAYSQGRKEADAAHEAALRLGFAAGRAIYYDLEGYSGATSSCRAAVSAFMEGWSTRLHELGARSGAYGSACTSYMSDWADNDPPLDNVWIAHWITDGYDPEADVWDARCLSNDLWTDHQRLRQYAGDHRETWGGVSLTIDSNAADGEITSLNPITPSRETIAPGLVNPLKEDSLPIQSFQMLDSQQGWAVSGASLLKTESGGTAWEKATLPAAEHAPILGSTFLDDKRGWLAAAGEQPGAVEIWRTQDGFQNSEQVVLSPSQTELSSEVHQAYLQFIDPSTGWAALKLQSSSNFSLGTLLKTLDGGLTWQVIPLPVGGPVRFLNENRGWVVGGVAGDDLFESADGGRSWSRVQLERLPENRAAEVSISLPAFVNQRDGFLVVTSYGEQQAHITLFKSEDAGNSWIKTATWPLDRERSSGSRAILASTPQGVVLGLPFNAGPVDTGPFSEVPTNLDGLQIVHDLPAGVIQASFVSPLQGWVLIQNGKCTGDKLGSKEKIPPGREDFQCTQKIRLEKTMDGGASWLTMQP